MAWGGRKHAETRVDGRAPKQATRNGSGKATGLHVNNRVKQEIGNGREATPWAGITLLGLQRGRSGPLVDTRTAHTNYKRLTNHTNEHGPDMDDKYHNPRPSQRNVGAADQAAVAAR